MCLNGVLGHHKKRVSINEMHVLIPMTGRHYFIATEEMQYSYKVNLRRVRETTFAVENQKYNIF
jgi:hypothetical protein